jgi:hypothetical protein
MILTREKGKEAKLCRVFTSSQELRSGKLGWIGASEYVGHIVSHKEFREKAENLIDPYESWGNAWFLYLMEPRVYINGKKILIPNPYTYRITIMPASICPTLPK